MSLESLAIALHHSRAGGTTKLVLVGIANHDGDGGAWPRIETLMKYAGRKERTVQDCITSLVALGEVVVHVNAGGDANTPPDRRPNLYEFVLECPPECDRTKHHRMPGDLNYGVRSTAPRSSGRGAAGRADGVRTTAPRGVRPTAPEPSLGTILEPDQPPSPPLQAGLGCAEHVEPVDGCRGCGTNPRAKQRRANAATAAADRAAAAEALRRQREAAPVVPPDRNAELAAQARSRLRGATQ